MHGGFWFKRHVANYVGIVCTGYIDCNCLKTCYLLIFLKFTYSCQDVRLDKAANILHGE